MVPERDKIASNVGEMAVSRALIELIVLSNMGAGFLSLIRVCVCVCVSGGWGGGCVYICVSVRVSLCMTRFRQHPYNFTYL